MSLLPVIALRAKSLASLGCAPIRPPAGGCAAPLYWVRLPTGPLPAPTRASGAPAAPFCSLTLRTRRIVLVNAEKHRISRAQRQRAGERRCGCHRRAGQEEGAPAECASVINGVLRGKHHASAGRTPGAELCFPLSVSFAEPQRGAYGGQPSAGRLLGRNGLLSARAEGRSPTGETCHPFLLCSKRNGF